MQSRKKRNKFTLVEILIAAGVMSLVLASLMSVYLFAYRMYQQSSALLHLDQQFRIAREKILGGIDGKYGVMEASQESVSIFPGNSEKVEWMKFAVDDNNIVTLDNPNDDINCRVMTNPGLGLITKTTPGHGKPIKMLDSDVKAERMEMDKNGDIVTIALTLSTVIGGDKFTRTHNMRVFLTND